MPWPKLRHPTPVIVAMRFRIKKERNIKNKPSTANDKVFLAPSTALESPPENII
jgi:hypothetical protein